MTSEDYEKLLPYATTPTQEQRIKMCIKHGDQSKASRIEGIPRKSINNIILEVKRKARKDGVIVGSAPFTKMEDHYIKGESALVDGEGNLKLRWVKTDTDTEMRLQMLQKAFDKILNKYNRKSKYVPPLQVSNNSLLSWIPIGDAHLGMLAWDRETGENFDLKIARHDLRQASRRVIEALPASKKCIIGDMGDYYHRNSNKNITNSGNVLDVDGRFEKMFEIGVDVLCDMIDDALEKFEQVIVRNIVGNHSPEAEMAMRVFLKKYYSNNERVYIEDSPNKFWYYKFGKVLLGGHHGDGVKHAELPLIMASDVPQWWGETLFRYFWIGHIHHSSLKEYQGCTVESVNNLAPNDAWHHASGYRSRKNLKAVVYHKDYGEIERVTRDISFIRDAQIK